MAITLDGTLGITTPAETVQGALTTTGNTILGDATTDTLNVGAGGLVKDASGNVGVAITPNTWWSGKAIQMTGGSIASHPSLAYTYYSSNAYFNASNAATYIANGYATQYAHGGYDGRHLWYNAVSGTAGNAITFTQAMTLDASGNLLVGTASATAGGTAGTIQNVSSSNYHYVARNSGATAGKYRYMGVDSSNTLLVYNNSNAGMYMADGGTAWVANSDERLKTDLLPIENAIEKVSTLRAVTGRYKSDAVGISRSFVIAQDVLAVLPEAVTKNASIANDDIEYLGVAYSDLIPLLIAGFKEQQALITALTTRITALEGAAA
jgi:hypothetical protein